MPVVRLWLDSSLSTKWASTWREWSLPLEEPAVCESVCPFSTRLADRYTFPLYLLMPIKSAKACASPKIFFRAGCQLPVEPRSGRVTNQPSNLLMHTDPAKTSPSPIKILWREVLPVVAFPERGPNSPSYLLMHNNAAKTTALPTKNWPGARRCQRWFLPQQSKWPPISTNAHRVGENGRLNSKIFVLVKFTYSDRTVLLPLGLP